MTLENNYNKAKNALEASNKTIKSMDTDIKQFKSSRDISEQGYISEIKKLKELIFDLKKKPKFKEVIKIKTIRVPVKVKGKTVYINKCEDIKVHRLDKNSSTLLKVLNSIGK